MVPSMVKFPQGMELRGMVHALSEYTPKFADVDTAPLEDTVLDVVLTAKVVSDKALGRTNQFPWVIQQISQSLCQ
jgi:hypothetical protein